MSQRKVGGRGAPRWGMPGGHYSSKQTCAPILHSVCSSLSVHVLQPHSPGPNFLTPTPSRTRGSWVGFRHHTLPQGKGLAVQRRCCKPQAGSGIKPLLSFEYLSTQVRTCGKFLCRKEIDIVPKPQQLQTQLFSLPQAALYTPVKDRTGIGCDAHSGSDRLRPVPMCIHCHTARLHHKPAECPEAIQTLVKCMGIGDLVPQAMGNRLPPLPQLFEL